MRNIWHCYFSYVIPNLVKRTNVKYNTIFQFTNTNLHVQTTNILNKINHLLIDTITRILINNDYLSKNKSSLESLNHPVEYTLNCVFLRIFNEIGHAAIWGVCEILRREE